MRAKLLALCVVLCLAIIISQELAYAAAPNLSGPLPGRLRAGYMSGSYADMNLLPQMAQVGMNASVPKVEPMPLTSGTITFLQQWAGQCKALNLAFIPVINWWDAAFAMQYVRNFNPVVTNNGTVLSKTPCPYTQDLWNRWINPRLLGLIQAAGSLPLAAVVIDTEMYNTEYSGYYYGCYCDTCYKRYMQAKGISGPLPPPSARYNTVNNAGNLAFYQSLQRNVAASYSQTLRSAAQTQRPGLRLGALQLEHYISTIPLQQGMALGFGTSQLPVFCFSEDTYSTGYSPSIASIKQYFYNLGANVDLVVGLWQSQFTPAALPAQLYYCAHDSYGYWIYTMETFANPSYSSLMGTLAQGWAAITTADSELGKLALNPQYVTTLQAP